MARSPVPFQGHPAHLQLRRHSHITTARYYRGPLCYQASHQQAGQQEGSVGLSRQVQPRHLRDRGAGERRGEDLRASEYNATSFFNDIAILKLVKEINFTDYVRPCCLWDGTSDLESIVDQAGKGNRRRGRSLHQIPDHSAI